jgi:hypothetical protein
VALQKCAEQLKGAGGLQVIGDGVESGRAGFGQRDRVWNSSASGDSLGKSTVRYSSLRVQRKYTGQPHVRAVRPFCGSHAHCSGRAGALVRLGLGLKAVQT